LGRVFSKKKKEEKRRGKDEAIQPMPSASFLTIYAGFYNWILHSQLGIIHFWIFWIGVNIVFLPMHGLGLAGMPRRIPDYPTS
jgi:heme/copper-type cytochrome/quinol oxidase subunit 1